MAPHSYSSLSNWDGRLSSPLKQTARRSSVVTQASPQSYQHGRTGSQPPQGIRPLSPPSLNYDTQHNFGDVSFRTPSAEDKADAMASPSSSDSDNDFDRVNAMLLFTSPERSMPLETPKAGEKSVEGRRGQSDRSHPVSNFSFLPSYSSPTPSGIDPRYTMFSTPMIPAPHDITSDRIFEGVSSSSKRTLEDMELKYLRSPRHDYITVAPAEERLSVSSSIKDGAEERVDEPVLQDSPVKAILPDLGSMVILPEAEDPEIVQREDTSLLSYRSPARTDTAASPQPSVPSAAPVPPAVLSSVREPSSTDESTLIDLTLDEPSPKINAEMPLPALPRAKTPLFLPSPSPTVPPDEASISRMAEFSAPVTPEHAVHELPVLRTDDAVMISRKRKRSMGGPLVVHHRRITSPAVPESSSNSDGQSSTRRSSSVRSDDHEVISISSDSELSEAPSSPPPRPAPRARKRKWQVFVEVPSVESVRRSHRRQTSRHVPVREASRARPRAISLSSSPSPPPAKKRKVAPGPKPQTPKKPRKVRRGSYTSSQPLTLLHDDPMVMTGNGECGDDIPGYVIEPGTRRYLEDSKYVMVFNLRHMLPPGYLEARLREFIKQEEVEDWDDFSRVSPSIEEDRVSPSVDEVSSPSEAQHLAPTSPHTPSRRRFQQADSHLFHSTVPYTRRSPPRRIPSSSSHHDALPAVPVPHHSPVTSMSYRSPLRPSIDASYIEQTQLYHFIDEPLPGSSSGSMDWHEVDAQLDDVDGLQNGCIDPSLVFGAPAVAAEFPTPSPPPPPFNPPRFISPLQRSASHSPRSSISSASSSPRSVRHLSPLPPEETLRTDEAAAPPSPGAFLAVPRPPSPSDDISESVDAPDQASDDGDYDPAAPPASPAKSKGKGKGKERASDVGFRTRISRPWRDSPVDVVDGKRDRRPSRKVLDAADVSRSTSRELSIRDLEESVAPSARPSGKPSRKASPHRSQRSSTPAYPDIVFDAIRGEEYISEKNGGYLGYLQANGIGGASRASSVDGVSFDPDLTEKTLDEPLGSRWATVYQPKNMQPVCESHVGAQGTVTVQLPSAPSKDRIVRKGQYVGLRRRAWDDPSSTRSSGTPSTSDSPWLSSTIKPGSVAFIGSRALLFNPSYKTVDEHCNDVEEHSKDVEHGQSSPCPFGGDSPLTSPPESDSEDETGPSSSVSRDSGQVVSAATVALNDLPFSPSQPEPLVA
ncbi:hypothetical protein EIP91_001453 [Steccherinum ochraceum]|uniref:Uncharacterized protein n=1 Tax=Steccherinum ochraceum TaxID=92696 RepID=A0A4R0RME5_9APHY|nr:hypothetical protein EIP91_001453 [Steccherinum ochraceum]